MINKDLLKQHCDYLNAEQLEKFDIYAQTLVQWNEKMNLTAITEPDEIVIKHFVDSLKFLDYAKLDEGAKIIDVGTGAGFPSVPLLIARPDIKLTLMDSLNKRLIFLDDVLKKCNLNAELVHSRAEDLGKDKEHREKYDFATARAVAPLNVLSEYCLPFVKVGGKFVALKGSNDEVDSAKGAIGALGGEIISNVSYKLPNGDARSIVITKKISQTPTKYPRNSKKISTKPL
jgi:16S rRNA (guanine527-N7)-methyltransferase